MALPDPAPASLPVIWYGGTFDPVHEGHLAIARAAAATFGVPVTLAPAADPPHRAAPGASAMQRAHMLDLAVAGDRRLRVDRRELHRPGPSWTVDTLRELRGERGPVAPLALLLGADSFRSLPQWRQWRQLPQLAHFIVAARHPDDALDALAAELAGHRVDLGAPEALQQGPSLGRKPELGGLVAGEEALVWRWVAEAGLLHAGRELDVRAPELVPGVPGVVGVRLVATAAVHGLPGRLEW